jgi:hypothetical protein
LANKKFTEEQIINILKEAEAGRRACEVQRPSSRVRGSLGTS